MLYLGICLIRFARNIDFSTASCCQSDMFQRTNMNACLVNADTLRSMIIFFWRG